MFVQDEHQTPPSGVLISQLLTNRPTKHDVTIQRLYLTSIRTCVFQEGRKEMFYLTTHSTHFIYNYMASDIWLRTILIVSEETRCCHIGYWFQLAARVLLYALSHRQDNTYHGLCYTSRGALAGTRNGTSDQCTYAKLHHWAML